MSMCILIFRMMKKIIFVIPLIIILFSCEKTQEKKVSYIITKSISGFDVNYTTEAMRLGVNDYLFKPFGLNYLLERVSHWLTKSESIRDGKRSTMGNSASNDHTLNMPEIVSHEVR